MPCFRSKGAKDATWGGLASDPLRNTPILGGQRFATLDEAMKALATQIGSSLVRRRYPLAWPDEWYTVGNKPVGFEIVHHTAFETHKAAADARPALGPWD